MHSLSLAVGRGLRVWGYLREMESQLSARLAESLDGFWRLQAGVALGWVPVAVQRQFLGTLSMGMAPTPGTHGCSNALALLHGAQQGPKQIAAVMERAESGALRLPQHIASVGASILHSPRHWGWAPACTGTKPNAAAINNPGCCTSRMRGGTQCLGCEVGLCHGAAMGTEPLAQSGLCGGMRMLCPQLCMHFWML